MVALHAAVDVASLLDGRELTIEEAALLKKVTYRTIQNWINQGLRAKRYGHCIRIDPAALAEFGVDVVKPSPSATPKNTSKEEGRIDASYAEALRLLR